MNKKLSTIIILAIIVGIGLSLASKSISRTESVSVYLCGPGTERAQGMSIEKHRPIKGYPVAYEYSKLSANLCIEKGKSYPMGFSLTIFIINSAIWTGASFLVFVVLSKLFSGTKKKKTKHSSNSKIVRRGSS